ncbi:MAG: hypothetical protein ABI399_07185 [Bauldia sp.]
MLTRYISGALVAGILLAVSAPVAFAADAPKDKAACEKAGMKWDNNKCIKK